MEIFERGLHTEMNIGEEEDTAWQATPDQENNISETLICPTPLKDKIAEER